MHPILFQIHGFFIGTYGVLIVIGLFAALGLASSRAAKLGHPSEFYFDLAFVAMLSGFIGARVLFIALNFGEFLRAPLDLLLSRSGFVFLGGFLAAVPASLWFILSRGMPMWEVGDIAAPSLTLAHAFGRIGCFLAGCCYGGICREDAFYAVRFPHLHDAKGETIFSFAYQEHLARGLIAQDAAASAPVIPTQLIESATLFLICGALLLAWRRRKFEGQIFALYLMFYGAARFMLEFLRGDTDRGLWLGGRISTSQIISLACIVAGTALWPWLRTRESRPAPAKAKPQPKAAPQS